MSSYLNVTNKRIQLLYQSNITLAYAQSEEECKGFLKVICRVGTKELKVVDTKKTCDFHEGKGPFLKSGLQCVSI